MKFKIGFKFFKILAGREVRNQKSVPEVRNARKEIRIELMLQLAISTVKRLDLVANLVDCLNSSSRGTKKEIAD